LISSVFNEFVVFFAELELRQRMGVRHCVLGVMVLAACVVVLTNGLPPEKWVSPKEARAAGNIYKL
jgi:hypothetical protein